MEFKVTVVNEIALGFHVLEKEKKIFKEILTLDEGNVSAPNLSFMVC